jgi:class 3 adenylate cyclase
MSARPRVLVADDSPDNLLLVQHLLSGDGYETIAASDGVEALRKIRDSLPDVILLDVSMPYLDGFEVCRELKADPATADIPVLLLTAWSEPDQRVRGLQLGAEDFLSKPFDCRELLARVHRRLRSKQAADELRAAQQAIRRTFELYASHKVVDRLLADPAQIKLGGVQQAVTILLADLRGYTAVAETLPPAQLVQVLNGHLAVAAQAVLDYEGTISQFVGDLVMAIYNAPLPQPDHAERACRAALALQEGMRHYHAALAPELRMNFGVGIVTGEAVVGNIGGLVQRNYTAIGDTVNLSQRLEEIAGGGRILIAESTQRALGPLACVESRGLVPVRGRAEPVAAYELLGLAG